MSIHKSLNLGGGLQSIRSVFTRRERLEKLEFEDRREEGDSVFGLPKVRTHVKVAKKKKAASEEGTEEGVAVAPDGGEVAVATEGEDTAGE